MEGKHKTKKQPGDSTYNAQWSGVSYSPTVRGLVCEDCGGHLHKEGDSKYCPYCDNFKLGVKGTSINS